MGLPAPHWLREIPPEGESQNERRQGQEPEGHPPPGQRRQTACHQDPHTRPDELSRQDEPVQPAPLVRRKQIPDQRSHRRTSRRHHPTQRQPGNQQHGKRCRPGTHQRGHRPAQDHHVEKPRAAVTVGQHTEGQRGRCPDEGAGRDQEAEHGVPHPESVLQRGGQCPDRADVRRLQAQYRSQQHHNRTPGRTPDRRREIETVRHPLKEPGRYRTARTEHTLHIPPPGAYTPGPTRRHHAPRPSERLYLLGACARSHLDGPAMTSRAISPDTEVPPLTRAMRRPASPSRSSRTRGSRAVRPESRATWRIVWLGLLGQRDQSL
jgi:hypothetical protein